jgi:signal transduction histidine kinase
MTQARSSGTWRAVVAWITLGAASLLSATFALLYLVVGGILRLDDVLSPSAQEVMNQPWWAVAGDFETVAAYLVFAILGALIVVRRDGHRMGWLFCAIGLVGTLEAVAAAYAIVTMIVAPGLAAGGLAAAWIYNWVWVPDAVLVLVFLPLLFPTGRLPSPRWRLVAWPAFGAALILTLSAAFHRGPLWNFGDLIVTPNPVGLIAIESPPTGAAAAIPTLLPIAMVGAGMSLIVRLRRATGEERRQLQWFVFFGAVAIGAWVLQHVIRFVLAFPSSPALEAVGLVAPLALAGLAASTGLVILRYRLYDIDRVVSRTLAYAGLAVVITALYLAIVVGIGSFVGTSSASGPVLPIVATALVALAFQPLRQRLQQQANRLVFGRRVAPYEALATLSREVAGTPTHDDVLPRLARAAAEGVGAARGRARVILASGQSRSSIWPPDGDGDYDQVVAVIHAGAKVGDIAVARSPSDPFTTSELASIADLAASAGPLLSNLRLAHELEARLEQISAQAEELRLSRERVLAAQDAERRRIERDIHDGAQQQLVVLAFGLGAARQLIEEDPARAAARLHDLGTQAGEVLQSLRDLARGVFPQLLADRGIAVALSEHIGRWCSRAELEVDPALEGWRFEPSVEAALYFVAREALQNAAKHAPDARVSVAIIPAAGGLVLTVTDDGPGFEASDGAGVGIQNMADRLASLGGSFEIRSTPGGGTTIRGTVPLGVDSRTFAVVR